MSDVIRAERAARAWTYSTGKLHGYLREPGFVDASLSYGEIADLPRYTMCVLKPEAVAGRRMRPALAIFHEEGFEPVYGVRFRFTPDTLRAVWRHNLNVATPERMVAMEAVLTSSDSLMVVLRDARWQTGSPPAAIRFTSFKGPSDPGLRSPMHLRYRLGVVNGLFNFVHSADEPIDLVRETQILLGAGRSALLDALGSDASREDLSEVIDSMEEDVCAHDLDLALSLGRLRSRLDESSLRLVNAVAASAESPSARLVDDVLGLHAERPDDRGLLWDLMTLVSGTIECNVRDAVPAIPMIGMADYQRKAGNA